MKLIIFLAALSCSYADKLERTYLPPIHAQTSGGSGFLQAPLETSQYQGRIGNGFSQNDNTIRNPAYSGSGNEYTQHVNNGYSPLNDISNTIGNIENRPERAQAALERNAAVLRQDNSNDGETYAYAYETENGIYAEENGVATNGVQAQGGFSYTGDDGQVYSIKYTADQNGFVPQGDHIPTAPPVPEEILKALEQNARDEAAGIYDDGSYNEAKYAEEGTKYSNGQAYGNEISSNDDTVVTNSAAFQPSSGSRESSVSAFDKTFNHGTSGVGNAYLPPIASQGDSESSAGRFGTRSQPSFNPRKGYRY